MSINAYIYLYTSKKLLNLVRQQYHPTLPHKSCFAIVPNNLSHARMSMELQPICTTPLPQQFWTAHKHGWAGQPSSSWANKEPEQITAMHLTWWCKDAGLTCKKGR